MERFINRDWNVDIEDDYKYNVLPSVLSYEEAIPVYLPDGSDIMGWKIQPKYE